MVAPCYHLILLLPATGGPDLLEGPFRLGIPHQAYMYTPLPEVHPPGYPGTDILGPADAQRLCKNYVVEDKGSIGAPTPTNYPLLFFRQDGREAAPQYYGELQIGSSP